MALTRTALLTLACALVGTACERTPSPPVATSVMASSSAITSASRSASPTPSPTRTTSAAPKPRPTPSGIPPVSAQARADGLIDVRTIVPDAVIDLRYATSDNFTKVRLYPTDARCLVHQSMAPGLKTAADHLRQQGYVIVFWDCYRPHAVQVRMFDIVSDPNWVARPTQYARSHEAGRSVDITLALARTTADCAQNRRVQAHCLLDMGTGFDDFTDRAHAYATTDVSATAQANRALLRRGMGAGGITVYSGEWWHFDGPDADVGRPLLTSPVN